MKPLVNKQYKLERFQGKGGWTYALIPEVKPDKHSHFGWIKVKGTIDDYEIKKSRLVSMGNGMLFLPVKAAIRKKIGKKEGDHVKIVLYPDSDPLEIPEEPCFASRMNQGLSHFLKHFPKVNKCFTSNGSPKQSAMKQK